MLALGILFLAVPAAWAVAILAAAFINSGERRADTTVEVTL